MPVSYALTPVNTNSYWHGRAFSKYPNGNDGVDISQRIDPPNYDQLFSGESCQVDVKGFLSVKPAPDSRIILVDAVNGNDANTYGSATDDINSIAPVQTLERAIQLTRDGYPDHAYLRAGQVFDGRLWGWKSGRALTDEPAVWGFYGDSGIRPVIRHGGSGSMTQGLRNNIHITGIEFYNPFFDYNRVDFDEANDPTPSNRVSAVHTGGAYNIWYDDCKFNFVNLDFNGFDSVISDIKLTRCIVTDNYVNTTSLTQATRPANLYTSKVDSGFRISECTFDMGGWNPFVPNAGANHFCHNLYLQSDLPGQQLVVENSFLFRGAGQGVGARPGGRIFNNLMSQNSGSLSSGFTDKPLPQKGVRVWHTDNVILNGRNHTSRGCDLTGCSDAMFGLSYSALSLQDTKIQRNLVAFLDRTQSGNAKDINFVSRDSGYPETGPVDDSTNVYYDWESPPTGSEGFTPRNLADYYQFLGGPQDEDAFIEKVKNRQLRQWDEDYTTQRANNWIRAGFNMAPVSEVHHGGY